MMQNIAPSELAAWIADPGRARPQLLDVREPWEHQTCRIPESLLVPMGEIPARIAELDAETPTVVICHHGARSLHVAAFLEQHGFPRVLNLAGGIDAWARAVDAAMPVY